MHISECQDDCLKYSLTGDVITSNPRTWIFTRPRGHREACTLKVSPTPHLHKLQKLSLQTFKHLTSTHNINSSPKIQQLCTYNMAQTNIVTTVDIDGLKKVASGKVREIFEVDDKTLLFVATDRISAYDVVMENVS